MMLSAFSFVAEWIIDERTTLSLIVDGPYGVAIKLTRGNRFFVMSEKPWRKFRKDIPMMKTPSYEVQLTKGKKVSVRQFDMEQYVCFEQVYTVENEARTSYTNLNTEQWEEFLKALGHIDQVLPPKMVVKCPECKNEKTMVQVDEAKRKATHLDGDTVKAIKENNKNALNQEMHRCEHCGAYDYVAERGCHCHRVTCSSCEPDGFCKCCGRLTLLVF